MTTPYGVSPLPESPLSINFKIPEVPGAPMLTVRGSNGNELANLTHDVALQGAQIGKSLTDFRAGFLAGAGLPSEASQAAPVTPPQNAYQPQNPTAGYAPQAPSQPAYQAPQGQPMGAMPWTQQQPQAAPPQTGGMGAAPTCPHGSRVWREGTSKNGPYKMWACPAPQGSGQCKPEWVK